MTEEIVQPPTNWGNLLSQIARDYDTYPALGIAHGVQKDAVQNGWGARVKQKGDGWSFSFELYSALKGEPALLAMTDAGTTGLTGKVENFESMNQLPDSFPPEERLARFECMFDSGGNYGPGLFGRGKLVFNAASRRHLIYYESMTIQGEYRLGKRHIDGHKCIQYKKVLEGEEAKKFLLEISAGRLKPIQKPGTRIIVMDPSDEVTLAIRNGDFLNAIQETWWEIIKNYGAAISVTTEKGTKKAEVPKEFEGLPTSKKDGWNVFLKENEKIPFGGGQLVVKRLHLLLPPKNRKMPPDLLGVCVHRKGMKVGPLPLGRLPDEIEDRFFGYVQLSSELDDIIADAETTTHYGFVPGNPAIRSLKKYVQQNVDSFLTELGYNKPSENPDERNKRLLREKNEDLNGILSQIGFPGFGAGEPKKEMLVISPKDLAFPGNSNEVSIGAQIKDFWYEISNLGEEEVAGKLEVFTREALKGKIETLLSQEVKLPGKKKMESQKVALTVSGHLYPKYSKVGCTARLLDEKSEVLAEKTFYIYVEMKAAPENERLKITLKSATWPNPKTKRRVNYEESISSLKYQMESKSPRDMKLVAKVRTLWYDEKIPLDELKEEVIELHPYESKILQVGEVRAKKEKYSEVNRGRILLRCRGVSLEHTEDWEKGAELGEHNLVFYLNMDPNYGFFDEEPTFYEGGAEKQRSECEPIAGTKLWRFRINNTHPAFQAASDDDESRMGDYLFEEMARQVPYVLLHEEETEEIRKLCQLGASAELNALEPEEVVQNVGYLVTDRILAHYYYGA